ncbi:LytR/AlgR family response regulator transcription factor [Paenibacillus ginsengihumi]|jgi:two-component system response regulator LytT|uniref:LytR/AlgR family response regulator transcription factor n=1 Tax=Paenibacillus ginsengihumi TaxID=431596 RepID=UPI00035EEC65|nr:LytTR family DNA-binding domain-containing protein [Paenibacillus ginsengihumi]
MRVMIAEDERLAREELIFLLSQEQDVELLPWASNGTELLELASRHRPQVVFVDIQMPGPDGMETAEKLLQSEHPPYIVFATAFEQYAIDAFRLEAVDYLLKPYDQERLGRTLQRIRHKLSSTAIPRTGESRARPAAPLRADAAGVKPKLLIDNGSRIIVVDPAEIAFASKEEKWTRIHMMDGQVYAARLTLQELEEQLGSPGFFRTHRSHLVNMECIDELEPWFNGAYNLILGDAKQSRVPLSRVASKELIRRLQGT